MSAKFKEHEVDIQSIVQRLYPVPKYSGVAKTYAELLETWEDERGTPTWEEIEAEHENWKREVATGIDFDAIEKKIATRIRELAIADLKAKGEIPIDYQGE